MKLLLVAVLVSVMSVGVWSEVPQLINYQGKLADQNGNPLSGSYSFRFSIWDDPNGPSSGNTLWFENRTLTVDNGVFNVLLGEVTPITSSVFSTPNTYLQIRVSGEDLLPRERLASAAYALRVASATVGGEEILNGSITNSDISATASIAASKLSGVLTTGGTRSDANLNTLTGGLDASSLHTHAGLTPGSGTVGSLQIIDSTITVTDLDTASVDTRYATLSTNQTVTGTKTFNGAAAPFAVGSSNKVTNLNADYLDGNSEADFLRSNVNTAYTSGTLTVNSGATINLAGTWQVGGNPVTSDAAELNKLDGANANVTAANLNALTSAGDASSLHSHAGLTPGANTVGTTQIINSTVTVSDLDTASVDTRYSTLGTNQTFTGTKTFNPSAGAPFVVGNGNLVSNLNADAIDGYSSSDFLRSNAVNAYTSGTLTFNAGTTLNVAGALQIAGSPVTADAGELNRLDGVTAAVTSESLNALTAGSGSDASAYHTHAGIAPGAHSATHYPTGSDRLDTVYLTTGTSQIITADKTFNAGVNIGAGNNLTLGGDVALVRGATANQLDLASGDSLNLVSGAVKIAGANAIDSARNGFFATSVQLGTDVVMSRGAANRLDVASGDSLNLVSGSLQQAGTTRLDSSGNLSVANITQSNGSVTASLSSTTVSGWLDVGTAKLRIDTITVTADSSELNKLDGFTGTTTELNTLRNGGDATTLHTHSGLTPGANTVGSSQITDRSVAEIDLGLDSVGSYQIMPSTITSAEIKDGTVANADMADNAINSSKISDGTITGTDIEADTIGAGNIATGGVTSVEILNQTLAVEDFGQNSVGSYAIMDSSVTTTEILDGTITDADVALAGISASRLSGVLTVGGNRTDTNLDTLTGGVDANSLHTHAGLTPGANTVGTSQISDASVALVDLNQTDVDTRYLSTGTAQSITGLKTFNPPSGAPFAVGNTTVVNNLNADLLDGITVGALLRSNANDSYTSGTLTFSAGTTLNVAGTLQLAGSAVNASAAELNKLSGAGVNVTAANLDTLTSGVDASSLHTHAGLAPGNNTVLSSHIIDRTIVEADLAQNSVGSYQIMDSTITSADIKDAEIVDADISNTAAIGWSKVSKTGSSLADLATRSASALNSGTLAIAQGGTGLGSAGGTANRVLRTTDGSTISVGTIDNNYLASGAYSNITGVGSLSGLTVNGDINQQLNANRSTSLSSTTVNGWLDVSASKLRIGGTAVNSTAAELNKLNTTSANVSATNLNTLTAGSSSDASGLHTHAGIVPGAHAASHYTTGLDRLDSVYLTTGTAQTITGDKTFTTGTVAFNATTPFTVANNNLVTNLNADLIDGLNSSVFLRSNATDQYTSGTLTFNAGTTVNLAGTWQVGGAAITASANELNRLTGIGGNVTATNLDTLTGGVSSFADSLHTHSGVVPSAHAPSHYTNGSDSLETVYLTTGTAQTISGDKTFAGDINVGTGSTITWGGDVLLSRGAVNRLDLASGDSINLASGGYMVAGVNAIDSSRNANLATSVTMGSDVQISRGAANRMDLASGDSLNIVSGSLLQGGTTRLDSGGNLTVADITQTSGSITASLSSTTVNGTLDVGAAKLRIGGATVNSTAAELNKLNATSANVTAANLNLLTAGSGSDANSLHTHSGVAPGAHVATHHSGGSDPLALNSIAGTLTASQADGVFGTIGLLKRTGAATYTSIADNSVNWDSAYTHSTTNSNVHGLTFTGEGAAGGLDADMVDGLSSGSFLRSDAASALASGNTLNLNGTAALGSTSADVNISTSVDVAGNITLTGTVDGQDISAKAVSWDSAASQSHARSHAVTSTSDHTATAWRVFYANGSGNVTELALGSSGQVLKSNGAASAPSWQADSGLTSEVDGVIGNEVTNVTDATLVRSGSGTGGSPYTLGLNLANANTWSANQTFGNIVQSVGNITANLSSTTVNGTLAVSGNITGPNVTNGIDPGHTHTAYSLTSHTHALSVTDADVATGANINATKIGTGAINNTEFNLLNGKTTLVDINDGVTTAITGLGTQSQALNMGSNAISAIGNLTQNSGNITANLSSTTVNGTLTVNGDINATGLVDGYDISASAVAWDTASSERRQWDGGNTNLNAVTGRASLGLGNAATWNIGTTAGTISEGNHSHTGLTPANHATTHHSGGSDPLDITAIAGTLPTSKGGTGTTSTLAGVVMGGNPMTGLATSVGNQVLRKNIANTAYEFVSVAAGGDPVGTSRSISTNNGISGGGDLAADRTLGLTGQALAFHNLGSNGIVARTGAGTVAGRTITGTANQVNVNNGDGVSGNPTLSLPQNIHTAATPTFGGMTLGGALSMGGNAITGLGNIAQNSGNITASLSSTTVNGTLTVTGAISGNVTSATTASNLAGGAAGTLPYQSGAGTTAMLAAGSSGQVLKSNGAAAPSWGTDLTDDSVSGSELDGTFSTNGILLRTGAAAYSTVSNNSANWDTGFSERRQWDGGATGLTAATGRTSLGLGGAATLNVGSAAGTVAAGDDSRFHTRSHAMTSTSDHTAGNWRVFYTNGTGAVTELALGSSGQVLKSNGAAAAPSWQADTDTNSGGTVTSVGLSAPTEFTVSGSPVSGSGTLTFAKASQSANLVWAAPNGAAGAPTFRALVDADIPDGITASNYYLATNPSGFITGSANITGSAGSISGFNNPTTAATANTIAYRDGSGDITARLFRPEYPADTGTTGNYFLTTNAAGSGTDNYSRPMSIAAVRTALGNYGGWITNDTSVPKGDLASSGTLGFQWADGEVSNQISLTGAATVGISNWIGGAGTSGTAGGNGNTWRLGSSLADGVSGANSWLYLYNGAGNAYHDLAAGKLYASSTLYAYGEDTDTRFVNATGDETIAGNKTFSGTTYFGAAGTYVTPGTGGLAYLSQTRATWLRLDTGTSDAFITTVGNAGMVFTKNNSQAATGTDRLARLSNAGAFTARSTIATGTPDLAEYIQADGDVEVYDVVVTSERDGVAMGDWNDRSQIAKARQPYDKRILGVVSDGTSSFIIQSHMNDVDGKHPGKPLVLAGRVPVKVCLENGPIKKGDYLTSSSKPGYAMKATEPGATVGIALEDFDGTGASGQGSGAGKVLCFVDIGERNLAKRLDELQAKSARLEQQNQNLRAEIQELGDLNELKAQLTNLQLRLDRMERQNRKGAPKLTNLETR